MRIAIDGRELEGRPTGVGRYLAGLLSCWAADPGNDEFTVYHRHDPPPVPTGGATPIWRRLDAGATPDTWWQQAVLARALHRERPGVLFAPADSMPLGWRGLAVLTVHDLSYFAHPEWFAGRHGARRRWLTRWSVRRATRIVAVSEFTRSELAERLEVPPERIEVVHHGVDAAWTRRPHTSKRDLRDRVGMPGPFALVVGSIFERRQIESLVRAMSLLGDVDLGLVVAGEDRRQGGTRLEALAREAGAESRIAWLGYCSDEDLAGLYRLAHHVIYLSSYEGFGLPPLEGMAFGRPAIVSDTPALAEIYGDSALPVHGFAPSTIADALRRLTLDQELHEDLTRRGRELAARLTLERCARETLAVIRQVGEQAP